MLEYYKYNREERHYGFLLLSTLLAHADFRSNIFDLFNERCRLQLSWKNFDIYAEVALFRDLWKDRTRPADQSERGPQIEQAQRAFLTGLLSAMDLPCDMIDREQFFWTGRLGSSKLLFPGRWNKKLLQETEATSKIPDRRLLRTRWLSNAKPDLMIQSGQSILFIEIKVESGMGFADDGYRQEETLEDIIAAGKRAVPFMKDPAIVKRAVLSHPRQITSSPDNAPRITWDEILERIDLLVSAEDEGMKMIRRHLKNIPRT